MPPRRCRCELALDHHAEVGLPRGDVDVPLKWKTLAHGVATSLIRREAGAGLPVARPAATPVVVSDLYGVVTAAGGASQWLPAMKRRTW